MWSGDTVRRHLVGLCRFASSALVRLQYPVSGRGTRTVKRRQRARLDSIDSNLILHYALAYQPDIGQKKAVAPHPL